MSDIIEEMGGYMGDGTELEPSRENARQKIVCPKCDYSFTWGEAKISEKQHAIIILAQHGFSIRGIGRMMNLAPESVTYRIKEAKRNKYVADQPKGAIIRGSDE